MHKHTHECTGCKHECLRYCECCLKVYCCMCGKEWGEYTYYYTTTTSWDTINVAGITTVCSHSH